jgi:hypothetical protein
MMFRLVRFLIITLTLGRIKWLMRVTWVWRLIVFLGITGWLSKRIRQTIGLDKKKKTDVDSAWAEALRYTPSPAAPGAASAGQVGTAAPSAPPPNEPISEARSEVTGSTEDGASETVTIHEVSADGETETIVRIADDTGNVETVVTGSPVEEIDLAHIGTPAAEQEQPVEELVDAGTEAMIDEIVEAEIEEEAAVADILDTLEAAEPEVEESEVQEAETVEAVEEPAVEVEEEVDLALLIDPDWIRGDGSHDCPDSHPVKAKVNSMIYYVPESGHYDRTIPDVCFAADIDAEAAGYRAPRR